MTIEPDIGPEAMHRFADAPRLLDVSAFPGQSPPHQSREHQGQVRCQGESRRRLAAMLKSYLKRGSSLDMRGKHWAFLKDGALDRVHNQVFIGLRFTPNDIPEMEASEGPLEMQEEAIRFWKACWARNEHPLADWAEKPRRQTPPRRENPQSPEDFASNLWRECWLPEPDVRSKMAHFLEDVAALRWALQTGLPVYGAHYGGEFQLRQKGGCIAGCQAVVAAGRRPDIRDWEFRCSAEPERKSEGWRLFITLALNCDGAPPEREDLDTGQLVNSICRGVSASDAGRVWPRDQMADEYHRWRAFHQYAGRDHRVVSLRNLPFELMGRYLAGWPGVFVKHTSPKRGVWLLRFPPQGDASVNPGMLFGLLVSRERNPDNIFTDGYPDNKAPRFMLQSLVEFEDEYRINVVGGRIVSGTPVRRADNTLAELLTPTRHGRLRPFMCADREAEGPRLERARTAAYARLARRFLETMNWGHQLEGMDFVLDIGTDKATGQPIVIEVNTVARAGLYGQDPAPILQALLEKAMGDVRQARQDWLVCQDALTMADAPEVTSRAEMVGQASRQLQGTDGDASEDGILRVLEGLVETDG